MEEGGVGMGVPTKRTDATRTTILKALRHGATYKRAAEAAGIHRDTLHEWMRNDPDFSEMVDAAVAESALFHLRNIKEHATDDWRASAWMMEHRFPHEYGRSVQELEHRGGLSINFNLSKRLLNAEEQKERASEAQETGA